MKKAFFVHSWRTLFVSLHIANQGDNATSIFLCCRGFFDIAVNLGCDCINLDINFSVPYLYAQDKSIWAVARQYSSHLRATVGNIDVLYIPHMKDPMMQFLVASLKYSFIDFIEEGCLFPRVQKIHSTYDKCQDFVLEKDNHEYFKLPSYKLNKLSRLPYLYCTNDNLDISGIELRPVQDESIRAIARALKLNIFELKNNICSSKLLHHIGTKDECKAELLHLSLSIANNLAKKLGLIHIYYGHPSFLVSIDSKRWAQLSGGLNVIRAPKSWSIEPIIFCEKALTLVGDSSTLMVTSTRLGHTYYHLYDKLKNYLPLRPAHLESSVVKMIKMNCLQLN